MNDDTDFSVDEILFLDYLKNEGIDQLNENPIFVEGYPLEKQIAKRLESYGMVVLDEYGDNGRSFFLAKLTDKGIVFVYELLNDLLEKEELGIDES